MYMSIKGISRICLFTGMEFQIETPPNFRSALRLGSDGSAFDLTCFVSSKAQEAPIAKPVFQQADIFFWETLGQGQNIENSWAKFSVYEKWIAYIQTLPIWYSTLWSPQKKRRV